MLIPFLHRLSYPAAWGRPEFFIRIAGMLSLAALGSALIAQHGFGLQPCEMCLWQRYPYYFILPIACIGGFCKISPRLGLVLLILITLLLAANAMLAFYHVGIERHLWEGLTRCTGSEGSSAAQSLDALRAAVLSAPAVRCDNPAWQWHGLTMAGLNGIFCATLAGFCAGGIVICRKALRHAKNI